MRNSDLRSRLARPHGERVDPLFRAWTGVWLSSEFRSWNIEKNLRGVLAPILILESLSDEYGTEKAGRNNRQNSRFAVRNHHATVSMERLRIVPETEGYDLRLVNGDRFEFVDAAGDVVLEVAVFHRGRELRRHWHNPPSVGQKGVETEISKEVI